MGEIGRDIVSILTAIVGVAMITVLVRNSSNTAGVIRAGFGGFSQALATAMGSGSMQTPTIGIGG